MSEVSDIESQINEEFKEDLIESITIESPFISDELTDPIFIRAIEKSLSDLSKYHPNIIKTYGKVDDPTYVELRSYYSEFDDMSFDPFSDELQADQRVYIYSTKWTIQSIHTTKKHSDKKYFQSLLLAYSMMFMANARRQGNIGALPFDLKGDQFYTEAKEKLDGIIQELINTAYNTA